METDTERPSLPTDIAMRRSRRSDSFLNDDATAAGEQSSKSKPQVSPYLDAFNMAAKAQLKRSSSATSLKSQRSAPSTPKPSTPRRTPVGARESGAVFTLEFNGGLRGASYNLMIKQQPSGEAGQQCDYT